MNRSFLRSITTNPETGQRAADRYLTDDYLLRAKTYERMSGGARTWPVRLTRCGEHPGRFGEFDQTDLRVVPDETLTGAAVVSAWRRGA